MSYINNELKSHPNKPLTTHLLNVAENSKEIINNLCIENKEFYANISFLIGLCHDFAKCTSYFQKHLNQAINTKKAYHSFLSAIFTYHVLKKYMNKINKNYDIDYPIIGYLIVIRHHGNLKDVYYGENSEYTNFKNMPKYIDVQIDDIKSRDLSNFKKFYNDYDISVDEFLDNFDEILKSLKKDLRNTKKINDISHYSILLMLFSVLIDSDKLDASYTKTYHRKEIKSDIVDVYKNNNFSKTNDINKLREEAYKEVNNKIDIINLNDKIYTVTLPTGSGKTLNVFSFALKLREKIEKTYNFKPRIIYSLPFLSIIDQNEEVIKEVLQESNCNSTDIFMKHNSLSEIYYKSSEDDELDVDKAEMLIEGWYSEIIITTFYQLFYTIFTNKNRSLRKYHNMANSIMILDEIQSIPPKYWPLIREMFKELSEKLNIWIIFMTATQPAIFKENEIIPLIEDENKYFNSLNRVEYKFHHNPIDINEFNEKIVDIINDSDKDIMIILNTIQSSLDVYSYIKEFLYDDATELYYLSTNIVPHERLNRIDKIKNSKNRKVIITTQLVEAGVDIDVDIIYRDFAPIDSLIQTAGRCNRNFTKNKGEVHVIRLKNENDKQYNEFIYDSTIRSLTEEIIKDYDVINEKDFNLKISEKYYQELPKRITKDDSEKILEKIKKINIGNITHDFKLIEKDITKVDIFVQINDEAKETWNKYTEIYDNKKLENYEKRREFKKIKNKFRDYTISIDKKKIGTLNNYGSIFYIEQDDLERKYDQDTGFIPQDKEDAFII